MENHNVALRARARLHRSPAWTALVMLQNKLHVHIYCKLDTVWTNGFNVVELQTVMNENQWAQRSLQTCNCRLSELKLEIADRHQPEAQDGLHQCCSTVPLLWIEATLLASLTTQAPPPCSFHQVWPTPDLPYMQPMI